MKMVQLTRRMKKADRRYREARMLIGALRS